LTGPDEVLSRVVQDVAKFNQDDVEDLVCLVVVSESVGVAADGMSILTARSVL